MRNLEGGKGAEIKLIDVGSSAPVFDTSEMEVVQTTDGYFRFVCHDSRVLTTGFRYQQGLQNNSRSLLATSQAIKACRARYAVVFGTGQGGNAPDYFI